MYLYSMCMYFVSRYNNKAKLRNVAKAFINLCLIIVYWKQFKMKIFAYSKNLP